MQFLRSALVAVPVLLLAACGPSLQSAKHYQLTGKVVSFDRPGLSLVINGDAVPGFMAAMAMPYKVKQPSELNSLVPGDSITAVVVLQNNDYWLENIRVAKHSSAPSVPSTGLHLPSSGDDVPNFELVNQNDKHIFLNNYRGKVLLVTFIYTRCPFPDYCPRITAQFAEVNRRLEADPALDGKTHLLSISFDLQHDTPSVLREYGLRSMGSKLPAAFDHWEFAVPLTRELPRMADFFGLTYNEAGGVINHSLSTAVIGPDGRIFSWYQGTGWEASDLVKEAAEAVQASS